MELGKTAYTECGQDLTEKKICIAYRSNVLSLRDTFRHFTSQLQ